MDRNALAVEAGLDWQASDAISLGVAYSGQIGDRAQDHAVRATSPDSIPPQDVGLLAILEQYPT